MAKKKDNTTIIVLAIAGFFLLKGNNNTNSNSGNIRYFRLPNGQSVPESSLPSLGYVNVQGQWYPASALNNAAGTANSGQDWQYWVNTGLGLGSQIIDIISSVNWNSNNNTGIPVDTGNGGGGFGGDPYDPNYNPFGDV